MHKLTFTPLDQTLNVVTEFDTGWNEGLQCGGEGRNEYDVTSDPVGVASVTLRAMGRPEDEFKVVYCRGNVYFSSTGCDGSIFNPTWTEEGITVTLAGKYTTVIDIGHIEVPRDI